MNGALERLRSIPWLVHLWRAWFRFLERLGFQFAAALTYFSVLSIVQVAMVAFAVLGLVLTVFRPDALAEVKAWIVAAVAGSGLGDDLTAIVDQAFNSWQGVGAFGLLWALWTGIGWAGNIRLALHTLMRPWFDPSKDEPPNLLLLYLRDALRLLGLYGLIVVVLVMSTGATWARALVGRLTGLAGSPTGEALLSGVPWATTLVTSVGLFWFLFTVFPEVRVPRTVRRPASVIGGVAMTVVIIVATHLLGFLSGNVAAAVFGSVVVLMLLVNTLVTIVLLVAAWIGTDPRYSEAKKAEDVPEAGDGEGAPAGAGTPA